MIMKKVISLILALVMCLSLCACGGGTGTSEELFLTKNEWKDIGDTECIFTFKKDGTGTFSGKSTTWNLSENKLSVSYQGSTKTMTLEFDIIENGTAKVLIECPNDIIGARILVDSNNYESECKNTKDYLLSQAEVLDWEKTYNEILANSARASKEHSGKIVKWTAKVFDIFDDFCIMSDRESRYTPVNPIHVHMCEDELIKFDMFDEITVVGILELSDNNYKITGAFVLED